MSKHERLKSCFSTFPDQNIPDHKGSTFSVVWDSGASVSITFDKGDFLNYSSQSHLKKLNSVGGTHDVVGEGEVLWSIVDTKGHLRHLKVKAYYVPSSNIRLLSIPSLFSHYKGETLQCHHDSLLLSGLSADRSRNPVHVDFQPTSRLPISTAYRINDGAYCLSTELDEAKTAAFNLASLVSTQNSNLSTAEKELLRWHFKLGHIAFSKVQSLMRSGILSKVQGVYIELPPPSVLHLSVQRALLQNNMYTLPLVAKFLLSTMWLVLLLNKIICTPVKKSVLTILYFRQRGDSSRLVVKLKMQKGSVVVIFLLIIVRIISPLNSRKHFTLMLQLRQRNHLRPMHEILVFLYKNI